MTRGTILGESGLDMIRIGRRKKLHPVAVDAIRSDNIEPQRILRIVAEAAISRAMWPQKRETSHPVYPCYIAYKPGRGCMAS